MPLKKITLDPGVLHVRGHRCSVGLRTGLSRIRGCIWRSAGSFGLSSQTGCNGKSNLAPKRHTVELPPKQSLARIVERPKS